ncbi:MAG: A24 family peptidase [Alphaproteobacteria bacterium]|nr:A24 family peptidase [Alphaproteobacteria bacterium]
MDNSEFFAAIFDLLKGGLLSLVAASLATNFGYRSADRLPGESRKPHCVFCLRTLQLHEYFPLFGWLFRSNAKSLPCPCGKRKGLWTQPAVELIGFVLGIAAVAIAGWSTVLIPVCLALGLLVAIAMIDLAFGLIPDELNFGLALLGFAGLVLGQGDVFLGLVGAAGLLGLGLLLAIGYSKIRGREMLGLGDVKFFAAAGLWLPLMIIPWFLFISGLLGAVLGLVWHRVSGSKEFPFAPALCASLAGCLYYQLYLYATP